MIAKQYKQRQWRNLAFLGEYMGVDSQVVKMFAKSGVFEFSMNGYAIYDGNNCCSTKYVVFAFNINNFRNI